MRGSARSVGAQCRRYCTLLGGITLSTAAACAIAAQSLSGDSGFAIRPLSAQLLAPRPLASAATSNKVGAPRAVQAYGRDSVYGETVGLASEPKAAMRPRTTVLAAPLPVVDLKAKKWVGELDDIRDAVATKLRSDRKLAALATATTTTVSIGYVLWLLRGGLLVASVLSSLPAWSALDPLPILSSHSRKRAQSNLDQDSVEAMFDQRASFSKRSSQTAASRAASSPIATAPSFSAVGCTKPTLPK